MTEENKIMTIEGIQCYEKNGTAYLNLEAVARGLGFTKKADSGNEVVNWTRVRHYLSELGVVQKCTTGDYIPENVFYRLAMKAKNEAAEKFQAKVADEIIPSIRRTGGYIATKEDDTPEEIMARALLIANDTIQRQKEHIERANAKIEQDKPKVLFADSVSASDSSILVGELAKLCKQNGVDIGQTRMFEWLRKNGYLMQTGSSRNLPTQRSMDMGLFTIKETTVVHADGHTTVNRTPKVTGKGQVYFVNKIMSKEGKHEKESGKAN